MGPHGGVVVEAGFADALHLGVGDEITLRTRVCRLMTRGEPPDCRVASRRAFEVAGLAVTAAARPYPGVCFGRDCPEIAEAMESRPLDDPAEGEPTIAADAEAPEDPIEPGLVWLTEADARALAPMKVGLSYVLNLKLADPAEAPAFVDDRFPTTWTAPFLQSWQDIRDGHDQVVEETARVLRIGSWLLGLLAMVGVAVLVGGRMSDQARRVRPGARPG